MALVVSVVVQEEKGEILFLICARDSCSKYYITGFFGQWDKSFNHGTIVILRVNGQCHGRAIEKQFKTIYFTWRGRFLKKSVKFEL